MALFGNKRLLLIKNETTYGTDAAPTASADAMLVSDLSTPALENATADRRLIRPFFGASEQLPTSIHRSLTFSVELAGSGTAGTAPKWNRILNGCAFVEKLQATAVTGTAQGGTSTTIRLAIGAVTTDDQFNGLLIELTGGAGAGQKRVIKDSTAASDTLTVFEAWDTVPTSTTTYKIHAQASYRPTSDRTVIGSETIYVNDDGVLRKMLGSRGSVQINLPLNDIPRITANFRGIWSAPTDTAQDKADISAFKTPVPVTVANTTSLRITGVTTALLRNLSLDMANNISFRALVNDPTQGSVILSGRDPNGSFTIEATDIATKDWETAIKDIQTGGLFIEHGTVAGNIVNLFMPKVQLTNQSFSETDGIIEAQMSMRVVPVDGDDEIFIIVR